MFKRESFLDITICVVAMYMLFNTDKINRTIFRVLVFAIILSLVYDLLWFIIKHNEFSTSSADDGGNETKLKQFILIFTYIAFILKVNYN